MIAFRHADPRFPFLREDSAQSAGRWNAAGELTHYFCDTPDGAWAEFLRHEEIDDPRDILTIRRALWAVEIGEPPSLTPDLPSDVLFGGPQSWSACTQFAREHRPIADGIAAPSAALLPGGARGWGARGWKMDGGARSGPIRDGFVFALFSLRPDLVGWAATIEGRPGDDILERVRQF